MRQRSDRVTLACVLCLASSLACAEESLDVWGETQQPLLYEHLLSQVNRQDAARTAEVEAALRSPAALERRGERLRVQLADMLGDFPRRTPLGARTVGSIACDGYRIEKVIFESRPHHHVTANLYLPGDTSRPVPGVLVPCGHSDNGKASEAYQSVCILLALNGCAALIYDPIGQGERHQMRGLERHGTTEHTLVGLGALLVGRNTANYRVWDGLRSMDYLASRPEVDPARLGCTGNSGGGTLTTWLMAVDPRIAVAAPSCFITTIPRLFATIGPQDCEQHFPAQGAYGIDHTDFITMRAPKPTLVLAAEQDFFDFSGTRQACAAAEAVYRVLGHPQRVGLFSFDDKHGFSQPRREAAVAWMRRWLADDRRSVREPTLKLQSDAQLQVTRTGQVIEEFADEQTVVDFNQRRSEELAVARRETWQAMDLAARRSTVRLALMLPSGEPTRPTIKRLGTIQRDGYTIEKMLLERPNEVPLPAHLWAATRQPVQRGPAVLVADARGKSADGAPGGRIEQWVRAGRLVLVVDLRGYGETADLKAKRQYANDEFRTAMVAMHLGRPLLGGRVDDLLAARQVLADDARVDPAQMEVVGVGRAGSAVLHAAALEPAFARVTLRGALGSWHHDVVARPQEPELISQVVPGVLKHYDLPDLEGMLGQPPVVEPAP